MITIDIVRQYQTTGLSTSVQLTTGYLSNSNGTFYLPVTLDNFTAPAITVTGVNGDSAATTLTASVSGAFDGLRVGDILTSTSVGSLVAPASFDRDCYTVNGLSYVVYPDTFDATTLAVSAGFAVSGVGVAAGAKVDKIDYEGRRIFLTEACDASGVSTLTFQSDVRVTAVRKSTETSNANEIDINAPVDVALVTSEVVFTPGVSEAILSVFKIQPTGSTSTGKGKFAIGAASVNPKTLEAAQDGVYSGDVAALNYVDIGTYTVDLDAFLADARVPRPTV